jgi:hypothetical protein
VGRDSRCTLRNVLGSLHENDPTQGDGFSPIPVGSMDAVDKVKIAGNLRRAPHLPSQVFCVHTRILVLCLTSLPVSWIHNS